MRPEELTKRTNIVPVMGTNGDIITEINLPEKIMPVVSKRVGVSESGIYYKGAGTIYVCHFSNEPKAEEKIISETGILYEQYKVCNTKLCGKYGIFDMQYQPVFSDLVGGCGPKEQNFVRMQRIFEKSAVKEIVSVYPTGFKGQNIYAYRLKKLSGSIDNTVELIEYILSNDYCTAWDKNLWADIVSYGFIRDVGDWYMSKELGCKLGTLYALLNSLYEKDIYTYIELLKRTLGVYNTDRHSVLIFAALIVDKYRHELYESKNIDCENITPKTYGLLLTEMFKGKACCHLENDEKWGWVRNKYLEKVASYEKKTKKLIINIKEG